MANDDFNDYFDGPDIIEPPKEPTPEEKEKMEEEADTIVVGSNRWRNIVVGIIAACVLGLSLWGYMRYVNPYISDAQKTGYLVKIEKRGFIFKTYEGEVLTEFSIPDTSLIFKHNFTFSIDNDSLAQEAMKLQEHGAKVTLHYKQYGGVLPWRGSSTAILTKIDRQTTN